MDNYVIYNVAAKIMNTTMKIELFEFLHFLGTGDLWTYSTCVIKSIQSFISGTVKFKYVASKEFCSLPKEYMYLINFSVTSVIVCFRFYHICVEEQRASTRNLVDGEEDSQTQLTKSSIPSHHASGHHSCHPVDRLVTSLYGFRNSIRFDIRTFLLWFLDIIFSQILKKKHFQVGQLVE